MAKTAYLQMAVIQSATVFMKLTASPKVEFLVARQEAAGDEQR